ncbi:MAG: thiamine biosynthesis protein ThiS [Opitutae bacterium]|nr:thiamine biosynthesis protein ThiS [Opitutae bacterium]|tara:strand:+ start:6437 stop:6640 length:204 start_codon:yes stop_codon:yes gene_type:complete
MKIYVNDNLKTIEEGLSLALFLENLEMHDLSGWAVAINEEIVPTEKLSEISLNEDDRIILVQATQGG